MQQNDICKVIKDKDSAHTHGVGAIVKVVMIGNKYIDPEPYYCKTVDGNTCYWYGEDELEVIEREGLI